VEAELHGEGLLSPNPKNPLMLERPGTPPSETLQQEFVVGVDNGVKSIERARELHVKEGLPCCRFEVVDGWDTAGLLNLNGHRGFHVIFVDVGGISGADGLFEGLALIRQLVCAFGGKDKTHRLRAIVVKSRCLRDHAIVWRHADDFLRGDVAPRS
jgi:hypothetical protein